MRVIGSQKHIYMFTFIFLPDPSLSLADKYVALHILLSDTRFCPEE